MASRSSPTQKVRTMPLDAPSHARVDPDMLKLGRESGGNLSKPWFPSAKGTQPLIPASLREDMIRNAAYLRAQARGFAPGREVEDWIAAEQEVDELIVRRYAS